MFTHDLGEGALLKILSHEDAEPLFALTDQNREHLRRWLPWVDHTKTAADTSGYIVSTLEQLAANKGMQCGVWYKGQLAGVIGHNHVDHGNRLANIGYWLGENFEGHGLITKACRFYLEHSFNVMKMNRVGIHCGVANKKSRAVPERLGMTLEGTLRQFERLATGFHDVVVYSMVKSEFADNPRTAP